jgi:hypothetical protein
MQIVLRSVLNPRCDPTGDSFQAGRRAIGSSSARILTVVRDLSRSDINEGLARAALRFSDSLGSCREASDRLHQLLPPRTLGIGCPS